MSYFVWEAWVVVEFNTLCSFWTKLNQKQFECLKPYSATVKTWSEFLKRLRPRDSQRGRWLWKREADSTRLLLFRGIHYLLFAILQLILCACFKTSSARAYFTIVNATQRASAQLVELRLGHQTSTFLLDSCREQETKDWNWGVSLSNLRFCKVFSATASGVQLSRVLGYGTGNRISPHLRSALQTTLHHLTALI